MQTILIDTYYHKVAPAGIKTYIEQLVKGSKSSGSDHINYIYSSELKFDRKKPSVLNSNNRLLRWVFQINYFVWKQFILPFKCLIHKVDVLICPDYVLPVWNLKAKKIVVLHDSLFWNNPEYYSLFWRYYYLNLINFGINKKTIIVTTSEYSKKSLKKVLNINNDIKVIYQSCSKNNGESFSQINKKNIIHVGSFEKRKNLLILLQAFLKIKSDKKNNQIKLVLAGSTNFFGQNKELKKIKKFIADNNLNNEVEITNYLSNKQIQKLYSTAFIYIFPSNSEGFGIPIIESFSNGVPVICSDLEVFKEIGNDSVLTFKQNDVNDLASKIDFLIKFDNKRLELIKKGFKRIKRFSIENFINSFEKLYTSSTLNG